MALPGILWLVYLLLVLGIVGAVAGRNPIGRTLVYGGSLGACTVIMFLAGGHLLDIGDSAAMTMVLPLGVPWIGAHLRLDPLASFFLGVINLGGGAAALYGLGYGRRELDPGRVLAFFPVFVAAMNLVVLADDAFTFLVSWEFMSLTSWALVMAHHRVRENAHAGYVYLMMASFGTLALLLGFGLLADAGGGFTFEAIRRGAETSPLAPVILLLTLLGAGSKAGIVPLHVWLPLAHPAAPSHVSALMSGVMTKIAVYALVRIVFDLLGDPQWWWGAVVMALGGITAVLGVLYALMQQDLKRLLAYCTVENIGIIYIGIGLALAFQANGLVAGAALATTAALFHVFNHAVFKSLLFFGAGAVLTATGERDMERLGGLIHRMPLTAFTFLIGSAAISALPPLNGFVSEWLTLQAILISPELPELGLKFLVPAVGALMALSAALAATCFVKAFGITFLGRPRSEAAATAREVDRFSLATMFILAGLCVAAGVLPGVIIDALAPVVDQLTGGGLPVQSGQSWLSLVPISAERSSYNGLLVLVFVFSSATLVAFIVHRIGGRALRRGPAWDCGHPENNPATQYTADSFAQPIRRVFGSVVFGASETVDFRPPGDVGAARLQVSVPDPVWERLYRPIAGLVDRVVDRVDRLQFLTVRRYLSMMFAALVTLLIIVGLWL